MRKTALPLVHAAARLGHTTRLAELLSVIDHPELLSARDKHDHTPLMAAIFGPDVGPPLSQPDCLEVLTSDSRFTGNPSKFADAQCYNGATPDDFSLHQDQPGVISLGASGGEDEEESPWFDRQDEPKMAADVQTAFSTAATMYLHAQSWLYRLQTMDVMIRSFGIGDRQALQREAPLAEAQAESALRCARLLVRYTDPSQISGGGLKLTDVARGGEAILAAARQRGSMLFWAARIEEGGEPCERLVASLVADPRCSAEAISAVPWRWRVSAFYLTLTHMLVKSPTSVMGRMVIAHGREWWLEVLAGGETAYSVLDDADKYLVRTYRMVRAMLAKLRPEQTVMRQTAGPFDDSPGYLQTVEQVADETELDTIEPIVYRAE